MFQAATAEQINLEVFKGPFETAEVGHSLIVKGDSRDWFKTLPAESIHAVVTDPPYGVREYEEDELVKRASGNGGIWRIPPSFDGSIRSPLPRFTALNRKEREHVYAFFLDITKTMLPALKPGAHVFVASNAFLSQIVFSAMVEGGLEFRGELIRLVQTLRGGDRPKNAEEEFPNVVSMPRGSYEPWGIFRKPIPPGMKVSDCLREYGTGGLRCLPDGRPFSDVIVSERTPKIEKQIAEHPTLKPQSLMRQLVYAALPLNRGVVVDPFMGAGSTIAAAEALGVQAIGVERSSEYFETAREAITNLSNLVIEGWSPKVQSPLPGLL